MRKSGRGFLLLYQGPVHSVPVLTVELASKWYDLYLVMPDGEVKAYPIDEYEHVVRAFEMEGVNATAWGDNVINPDLVQKLSQDCGLYVDPPAFDMIVGRWVIEHKGHYERW